MLKLKYSMNEIIVISLFGMQFLVYILFINTVIIKFQHVQKINRIECVTTKARNTKALLLLSQFD